MRTVNPHRRGATQPRLLGATAPALRLPRYADAGGSSRRRSLLATYSTSVNYSVVNQWNGACLDAPSVAQAQVNACSGAATQQWTLVASSYGGYYQLQNVGLSGGPHCLDLSYGTLSSGQAIDVWYCSQGGYQMMFTLPPVGVWGSLSVSASGGSIGQSSGFCVDNGARPSPVTAAAVTRARRLLPTCRHSPPAAAAVASTTRTVPGVRRPE